MMKQRVSKHFERVESEGQKKAICLNGINCTLRCLYMNNKNIQ